MRDRAPERAAIELLRTLRAGGCNTIPAATDYCPEEARFKIVSWTLTGRAVDGKDVVVRFWVTRSIGNQRSIGDAMWVWVHRGGDGWKADRVETIY